MTETAKQDATKTPAEPAATESAASKDEAEQETAAEAAETTPAEAGEHDKDDIDETKRKFREALERKHEAHNDGQGKGGRDGGKINGAHGPAASRRNFRRKSG